MCRWEQVIVPGDLSKEEDVKTLFARAIETFGKEDTLKKYLSLIMLMFSASII